MNTGLTTKEPLKGYQKKFLKGLAHELKPVVFIGQKGVSPTVIRSTDEALHTHELIKIKFIDNKDKDEKKSSIQTLVHETASEEVGMIGHVAILYRFQKDPVKRKIELPVR